MTPEQEAHIRARHVRRPWTSAIEDVAMDLAERALTEEEFTRLWGLLGQVVRYLANHDVRPAEPEPEGSHEARGS